MFITISELEETTALKDDDVFAISTMNGSTESTKKIKFSNLMGGMSKLVEEATESLNGLSFGTDSSGNWGFIKPGADSVTPFKSQADIDTAYRQGKEDGAESAATGNYNQGKADGEQSAEQRIKQPHKLTVPTARNSNATITANWYTTVDNTACYDAGAASVKTAKKLVVPTTKNANASITAGWYTSVDNTACYDAGFKYANSIVTTSSASYKKGLENAVAQTPTTLTFNFSSGAAANDGGIMRTITNLALSAQFYIPPGYTKIKGSGTVTYGSASLNLSGSYQTCQDGVIAQVSRGAGSGSMSFSITISK